MTKRNPMRTTLLALLMTALFLAGGCSPKNPHYDLDKPHHTPKGFQNNYSHTHPSRLDFWRWTIQRQLAGLPKPPRHNLSPITPDLAFLRANMDQPAATWIGHAAVLMQMGGLNILTDPQFFERASPLSWAGPKRWQAPGAALANRYLGLLADPTPAYGVADLLPFLPRALERALGEAGPDLARGALRLTFRGCGQLDSLPRKAKRLKGLKSASQSSA